MEITDKKIDELAHLARLSFKNEDKQEIKKDLERILDFCNKLNELDTTNVEPLVYMSDRVNHLRNDIVEPSLDKKEALKNAPVADSDFFKVPKVINK
ncbi:MAG: Asp-tRNA(Asn)/Glu-tRNA(Gln) amidotransferase subunit GatC [Flavobacteriales bacterium]|nr:Asp-tRNA(Asn)/Glu-tRNA(Gln) amidotransferase subunit GatC [Flavobacteriales bacterium]